MRHPSLHLLLAWRLAAAGAALLVATLPGAALLVATLPGGAASPDPASLRVSPEEAARARTLVRRLGSDIFQERDGATRDLAAMGRRALVALDEARGDADPEVSARVAQLYPRASLDDVGARVASFLADADARYEHDIPGWPKFRAAVGDDAAGRELFAEIVADKDNHEILAALGGVSAALTPGLAALAGGTAAARVESVPPAAVRRALATRWQRLLVTSPPWSTGIWVVPVPAFALLLLADSYAPAPEPEGNETVYRRVSVLLDQDAKVVAAYENGHKYRAAVLELTWLWLETRPAPDGPGLAARFGRTTYLKLDPARLAPLAVRSLRYPTAQPYDRVVALDVLLRAKSREHLAALATVFADERPLIRQANVGGFDLLVCDYALSVALELTGQRPADYGLTASAPIKGLQWFTSVTYHFKADPKATAGQKRLAAFDRWRAFEAAQLGSVLGGPLADRVTAARLPRGAAKPDPKPLAAED